MSGFPPPQYGSFPRPNMPGFMPGARPPFGMGTCSSLGRKASMQHTAAQQQRDACGATSHQWMTLLLMRLNIMNRYQQFLICSRMAPWLLQVARA